MRQFIPEGEELTPAEKAIMERRISQRDNSFVEQSFVPGEGQAPNPAPDRAERERRREEAAARALARAENRPLIARDIELEAAREKLRKLGNAQNVISYIEELSAYHRRIFLQAEMEELNRKTVLQRFSGFLPTPKEES